MKAKTPTPPVRSTYRHGNLRHALLTAGIALAHEGGPHAVVLREATRRAGVVPNAAYRHFASREALLAAVRAAALSRLAVAMEKQLASLGPAKDTLKFARASLRAVGVGYLHFARTQTGLFRTAFAIRVDAPSLARASKGSTGLDPFELLGAALDRLVRAGGLPATRRPGAEYLAWSAVHGMAMLTIDGPLQQLSAQQLDRLGQQLLDMVENGLGVA